MKNIEINHSNSRAHEEVVVVGALLRMDAHRLLKRVISGELENAGESGRTAW